MAGFVNKVRKPSELLPGDCHNKQLALVDKNWRLFSDIEVLYGKHEITNNGSF